MRDLWKLLAVIVVLGVLYGLGFRAGFLAADARHDAQATLVAMKAEEASQRATQALSDISASIAAGDLTLDTIEERLNREKAAPDACAIDTGRLLKLDEIR